MYYGCVNVFQDKNGLRECLSALRGALPADSKLVVVDGAYKEFPHDKPYSTDGTIEVAHELADIVIETKEAWENEEIKRSQYFIGKEDDVYIVVDADETIQGKISEGITEDHWILLRRTNTPEKPYYIYRIHVHKPGIRYQGTHHAVWDDIYGLRNILLENRTKKRRIVNCELKHNVCDRRLNDLKYGKRGDYHRWLQEHEREFRRQHSL